MNIATADPTLAWVVVFIVVVPLFVIGAGEIQGRLRYRDSAFVPAMSILRTWVLPVVAIWMVTGAVLGFDSVLARVVASVAVVAIGAELIAVVRVFIQLLQARAVSGARRSVPRLLLAVPQILIITIVGWILVAGVWDFDLSSLFAALGVTTLIISVALQDTLSGIASGFLLMLDRPFQPGDWITADDIEGKVVDTNWRSSRIQNRDLDLVVVPNGKLAGATIINHDEPARLHRVQVDLQVAFSNPPTLAKDMILDAARSVDGVLADPAPSVHVTQIDDPLMGYEVRMWIEDFQIERRVESDFRSLVWYMSHRHDVPLPSPAYDLYNYDGLAVEAAGARSTVEVRQRLLVSDLLENLGDDEIDRLAAMSKTDRFSAGELIADRAGNEAVLYTLWEGSAHLEVVRPDGVSHNIASLAPGDVFGLVAPPEDHSFVPRVVADVDCEVVSTNLEKAGTLIARNPALVGAITQITTNRNRRIQRIISSSLDELNELRALTSSSGDDEVDER